MKPHTSVAASSRGVFRLDHDISDEGDLLCCTLVATFKLKISENLVALTVGFAPGNPGTGNFPGKSGFPGFFIPGKNGPGTPGNHENR